MIYSKDGERVGLRGIGRDDLIELIVGIANSDQGNPAFVNEDNTSIAVGELVKAIIGWVVGDESYMPEDWRTWFTTEDVEKLCHMQVSGALAECAPLNS